MSSEDETMIKNLHRKRGAILASITNFSKKLERWRENPSEREPDVLEASLELLKASFSKFDEIQDKLEELDFEKEASHRESLCDAFSICVGRTKQYIREHLASSDATDASVKSVGSMESNASQRMQPISANLPKINLPHFDGSIEGWASFFDMFSSLIDKNPDMSPVTKLQYLRLAVTGQAAQQIQSLESKDSNYEIAIKTLKDKYDNPRHAMRQHWSILREYPKLPRDKPALLGKLVDTFKQHLMSLENLGAPIHEWSVPIIDLILTKIGPTSIWNWEITLPDKKMPHYSNLLDFLEKRANSIGLTNNLEPNATAHSNNTNRSNYKGNKSNNSNSYAIQGSSSQNQSFNRVCVVCTNGNHPVYICDKFKSLSVHERRSVVSNHSLCFNCLKPKCNQNQCAFGPCRSCGQKHNTLLCLSGNAAHNAKRDQASTAVSHVINSQNYSDVITTALVDILDKNGKPITCRALVDTCSTTSFVTERLCKKLQLKRAKSFLSVRALNGAITTSTATVDATIRSKTSCYQKTITFHTVENISGFVPNQPINRREIRIPKNIQLADPSFEQPAEIDLLLASGLALSILCKGQINLSEPNGPDLFLQKTLLGWVIGGSAPTNQMSTDANCHLTTNLESRLQKFFELEEVIHDQSQCKTPEEALCEKHFTENTSRDSDGVFTVALPFNEKVEQLGESKQMAQKRLQGLKRRFQLNPELETKYRDVMQGYIALNHISPVEGGEESPGFYLPHHPVMKKDSPTTATRVVFDGSAKTSSGISLNDALMTGPTVQSDLFSLILRFRKHKFVITGDLEKMYRQFRVRPEDRKYQRILWFDSDGNEKTFESNTVVFGLTSSPFLACRCINQLADEEKHDFPEAAKIVKSDFYVDNVLTGSDKIDDLIKIRIDLTELLKRGGVRIYQWASNAPEILEGVPHDSTYRHLMFGDTDSDYVKTLGIQWNSNSDTITYAVKLDQPNCITKRSILSQIARIFDPLGLVAPVITFAKIQLQTLWILKLHWDESLPLSLHDTWSKFCDQLRTVNDVKFDRRIIIDDPTSIELHGFSDASSKAYGCCIYVRSTNIKNQIKTNLLCAKSRVAPVKSISIPRLELCAAFLLSKLVTSVKETIDIKFDITTLWTDSTVVLSWLQLSPARLQTFVANRVSMIQSTTNICDWRYVHTKQNPADLISRGQMPADFNRSSIWQHGPEWLSQPKSEWPNSNIQLDFENSPEMKKSICLAVHKMDDSILFKYSSFDKLQRVVARCLRIKNRDHTDINLTVSELDHALKIVIKLTQKTSFPEEIECFERGKPLHSKCRLLPLNPFLDQEGIIRVGGRLKNSELPYSQQHPMIIPNSHHVTTLLIWAEHHTLKHAGAQTTLYALRRRFWLIDGRNEVRKTIRKCITCFKLRPPSTDYLMGDLPVARVTQARPFSRVGVDFCGPFYLKEKKYRNRNKVKSYVSIFVCLSTRSCHLEAVSDLTTESFLGALKRFVSRRGLCSDIYSDNGATFKGANNELLELHELLTSKKHQNEVNAFTTRHQIQWHFIPARAPNFGGLWEAGVKSFKHHLHRVVGSCLFTYEEFSTFISEVEAILNSRPLTPMSTDPNDPLVLTPGHFLIGDSLKGLPELEIRDLPVNRLSHWQHIQQVKQHFWSRWSQEYLNELTVRSKWTKGVPSIKVGTLVLLKEDNLAPLQWVTGRIIQCHPGADGVTRVVTIKTATTTLKRSVRHIAPLPIQPTLTDNDDKVAKK